MAIQKQKFGVMPDGREAALYTITNLHGLSASFSELGAVWVNMLVPDRDGKLDDILLGYDNMDGYLRNGPHFGAVVGRVANRTGGAAFTLKGKSYHLQKNNGENNLHSGLDFFEKRFWASRVCEEENSVTFTLESPDNDQGFPGNASISVCYRLTEEDCVEITYQASCDQATPMNLTNHAYFNLGGHDSGSVCGHRVRILSGFFTPSFADSIPTGEILSVGGTPMDFREEKEVGLEIDADDLQMKQAGGYDHNWCLEHEAGTCGMAASAFHPESGRYMEVLTDLPGIQFYTGNFLKEEGGKNGAFYGKRSGMCFETQFYPDSLNKAWFPSPILQAGERFQSVTCYRFGVRRMPFGAV